MNFLDAIKVCFQKYVVFSGRAHRTELWYWVLFCVILSIAAGSIDRGYLADEEEIKPLQSAFGLITMLPSLAVNARRLHDIARSGWWQLIVFTIIGIPVLIYWFCQPSQPGSNQYGPNPYGQ